MDPESLAERGAELLRTGNQWCENITRYRGEPNYWFKGDEGAALQSWIASVANFFRITATPDTYFHQECLRVIEDEHLRAGVPFHVIQKLVGLLDSILEENRRGLLRKAEYIFAASTFDDFLDHAVEYHKAGKKVESAVLGSAVFEDTVRKVAVKNEISQAGVTLDFLVDELVKSSVITAVKGKRLKAYAAVRNKALHAQWDELDLRDVGQMIEGTRELIEHFL
jgi:hypothetical protein